MGYNRDIMCIDIDNDLRHHEVMYFVMMGFNFPTEEQNFFAEMINAWRAKIRRDDVEKENFELDETTLEERHIKPLHSLVRARVLKKCDDSLYRITHPAHWPDGFFNPEFINRAHQA